MDSLIWPRDLAVEGTTGHVDFPRMRRGGLDAAAFTIPTRFFGLAGFKAFHDLRPPATWFSAWERLMVDLAHAGPKTFDDALAQTRLPPIVSHAGARAVHDTWRNLSDGQIRAVAQRGGVIGVMLVPPALDRPDLFEALEHLAHIVEVGGEDVAALGSDLDGYMRAPIDASGLAQLTELMLRAGWSALRIRKILGENVLRVMGEAKQAGSTPRS